MVLGYARVRSEGDVAHLVRTGFYPSGKADSGADRSDGESCVVFTAPGIACVVGLAGVDAMTHVAYLITTGALLEAGADARTARGGVVVGVVANEVLPAFGGSDEVALDLAWIAFVLVQCFP